MAQLVDDEIVMELLPDSVTASLEVRERWLSQLPAGSNGEEFVVDDFQKWAPGQTVRVAFLGGDTALYTKIAGAVAEIESHCNLRLDLKDASGRFRTWSPTDTEHAAEIRVSFDQRGLFSLVGSDSADPNVGAPSDAVGGRAGQRSLNLEGFDVRLPATWKGTVLHEFLHALAFRHEHTNRSGPCQNEFRFEDDPGYQPTRDSRGVFVPDRNGRRPGVYTYLAGAPNFWTKAMVDHNLRPSTSTTTDGPFDRASVMLYRFDDFFYKTPNSPCAPSGNGQSLSAQDIAGLEHLYPAPQSDEATKLIERREDLIATLDGSRSSDGGGLDESTDLVLGSPYTTSVLNQLRRSLEHFREKNL